jgi:drug/metabolite transporter (DMT)-like permease
VSRSLRRAYAAWIAVCVIWGTTYLGIRVALDAVPPALMGGIRWTVAGLLLVMYVRLRGERLPLPSAWGGLAVQGLLMLGFGNGLVAWAEQHVPSGLTAVILSTSPFFMAGVEAFLQGGERLSRRKLVGLMVGFVGILVLVWPDLAVGGAAGLRFAAGIVALQVACLGWALGSSLSKRRAQRQGVLGSTAVQMVFGGLQMTIVSVLIGEWSRVGAAPRGWLALAYLTFVGSIGGFVSYIYALKHLPVSTVSLYAYVNPVIAVVLGAVLLREPFGLRTVVAIVCVFAGVGMVRMRERPASLRAPVSVGGHSGAAASGVSAGLAAVGPVSGTPAAPSDRVGQP